MNSQITAERPALTYVGVFFLLAVITVVEILLASPRFGLFGGVPTGVFLILSLSKASLVAAFYMHLRSDVKLFTLIFLLPVALLLLFTYLMVIS
jgi:caa(3)-type oxidase subunit IV